MLGQTQTLVYFQQLQRLYLFRNDSHYLKYVSAWGKIKWFFSFHYFMLLLSVDLQWSKLHIACVILVRVLQKSRPQRRYVLYMRLIIRNQLTCLWRLRSPKICPLKAGYPGKLAVQFEGLTARASDTESSPCLKP